MTALILTGYLASIKACVDFDCTTIRSYEKNKVPCTVKIDKNRATIFGINFELVQTMFGQAEGFSGKRVGNSSLTIFFKPKGKPLRVYLSQYLDRRTYKRWTCEFGRENESEW